MPNKRDISLDKYDISKERYRELYYFCQQYREKKERLKDCYSIRSPKPDASKRGCTSDVVVGQVENAMKLERDIEIVEQCAIAADSEIYKYIIKNVTEEGMKYEFLKVPASRKKFYKARRKFFYLLDRKKG